MLKRESSTFQLVEYGLLKGVTAARPLHHAHSACTIQLTRKENEHDDRRFCNEWHTIRLFNWSLGHGMGMVAEKWFLASL